MKLTKNQSRGLCRDRWTIIARMLKENPSYNMYQVKVDSLKEMGYNYSSVDTNCFCWEFMNEAKDRKCCIIPRRTDDIRPYCLFEEYGDLCHKSYTMDDKYRYLIAEHIAVMADRAINHVPYKHSAFGLTVGDSVHVILKPKLSITKV